MRTLNDMKEYRRLIAMSGFNENEQKFIDVFLDKFDNKLERLYLKEDFLIYGRIGVPKISPSMSGIILDEIASKLERFGHKVDSLEYNHEEGYVECSVYIWHYSDPETIEDTEAQ